ncbi:MAG TPA: M67 family metallopeptidase [Candidatus Binatia bacterium]|jgi:proteasome lid subunit RPN8/RPN11
MMQLTHDAWNEISRHAEDEFPEECCGVVLSNGMSDRAQRLRNIQNELHARDPKTHPRTAAIAYNMDVRVLDSLLLEAEKLGYTLKAFYHSHPNHDAYFSPEDRDAASPFGEPTYPDAAQIVVSVYNRVVNKIRAFAWSGEKNDFVEVPINRR